MCNCPFGQHHPMCSMYQKPMTDPLEQVREMRERFERRVISNDKPFSLPEERLVIITNAMEPSEAPLMFPSREDYDKALGALEAVLAMPKTEPLPMRSIAGDSYMEGRNSFRSEVHSLIASALGGGGE